VNIRHIPIFLLACSFCVWTHAQPHPSTPANALCSVAGDLRRVTLESQVFHNSRTLRVWLPPGYDSTKQRRERYPVLYLNDGQDVFDGCVSEYPGQEWRADEAAAQLIRDGKVRPLIIVGIDNAGRRERAREYLPFPDETLRPAMPAVDGMKYPRFLLDEVIPLVNRTFRTDPAAEQTGIGGSSYGAGIALYTVFEAPGRFGRLLLESPSLYAHDDYLLHRAESFSKWPERIFIGVGTVQEPVEDVDSLDGILTRDGLGPARLRMHRSPGAAHNPDAWASRFPEALEFLYGAVGPGKATVGGASQSGDSGSNRQKKRSSLVSQ